MPTQEFDLIIRNGRICDGSGSPSYRADLAINGQKIAAIGDLRDAHSKTEVDAKGMAVSPGFVNMMSWGPITLIEDGRSMSDILQGVTLEVFGEGWSEGPINEKMRAEVLSMQGDIKYEVPWTTLGDYLEYMEKRGVSPNITSFVGGDSVRIYAMGYEDRSPTREEMELMKKLVRQSMEEGAVGMSTALIYMPGCFSKTEEIIELAKVMAEYDGLYASHIRSEGNAFLEALDEFLTIAREAGARAEVYHLKVAGKSNLHKMDAALQKIEEARARGMEITADMYTYTAGATGLDACMPRWVQEGGHEAWVARLKDPSVRERLKTEIETPSNDWENMYLLAGSPENVLLIEFRNDALKPLTGKTLAEVATMRGTSPADTMMDLVVEDDSRVGTVFFTMTEDNLKKEIQHNWVSLCSDAGSVAAEGVFLKSNPHPRTYGSFVRLLAKYVREEGVISLEEGIRRMTSLPCEAIRARERGLLKEGYFADVVIFDPDTVQDHATFENPHQYATGVEHVFVNGAHVVKDGQHTGAKPGRVVRGPGWKGW